AIARNKLRASLTVLGILIGIAAVVAMTALGEGAKAKISEQMRSLGANMIVVFPGSSTTSGAHSGSGTSPTLTEEDADAIRRECPSVASVAPALGAPAQVVYEDSNDSTRVTGTTLEYFRVREWKTERGSLWTEQDENVGARVCLIGTSVRDKIFGVVDPI